jgi:hypothetical protein
MVIINFKKTNEKLAKNQMLAHKNVKKVWYGLQKMNTRIF